MDVLNKDSYGFETKKMSSRIGGTAMNDQHKNCGKEQVLICDSYKHAGMLNQRSVLEGKLSIFRDKIPDQWHTGEVEFWAQKLCREPEYFNRIVQSARNKCLIVPSLDRSSNSLAVREVLANNPDFLLIALDNLIPSYTLSVIFRILRENEKNSYQQELFFLQQQKVILQQEVNHLEQLTQDKDAALEKTRGKLVRNTDPKAATEKNIRLAGDFAESIIPFVDDLRKNGYSTYRSIAEQLNNMGIKTRVGKDWSATAVMRIDRRKEIFEEQEVSSNVEEDCLAM